MTYVNSIKQAITQHIAAKIGSHRALLIGFSGGVDSTVLLHVLVELKKQQLPDLALHAIYIHHGISKNADYWAEHCAQICREWQIPFAVKKVSLDLTKGNVEQQARQARYQAILSYRQAEQALCTAQHLDDQCETFFLALKRGSGPTGLSAMSEETDVRGYTHLRPLLAISRQQIEQYAAENQLRWIEDESNQDCHYDRNFLRLDVLPTLTARWSHFNQMVARSAELCQEQQQLLEHLLAERFAQLIDSQHSLAITPLLNYDSTENHAININAIERNAILRMWFKQHQITMPTRQQLERLWQEVALAKEDSNPKYMINGKQLRRYQNRLYLLPDYADLTKTVLAWHNFDQHLCLPDQLGQLTHKTAQNACRAPLITEQVTVRFMAQGAFHIVGRNGSRQIKKLWQEFSIPPWQRNRIPLIYYSETLICAVGVFVTEQGKGNEVAFSY